MTTGLSAVGGAWVDLVALDGRERVLARAEVGDMALQRLGDRVASLVVLDGPTHDHDRLVAALSGSVADVEVVDAALVDSAGAAFDVVVTTPTGGDLERLARLVRPDGRLVLLTDNPVSPLRALDRLAGHRGGPTSGPLGRLRGRLIASGLDQIAVFGLLRSSSQPTTAFRLDLPEIAEAVLQATASGSGPWRRWAIDALRVAARWGLAGHLLSAWLVVAGRRPSLPGDDEPTGRIAVAANEQGVVLLGAGPAAIEKHYTDVAKLEATASALSALEDVGLDVGTRVIGRPRDHWLRLTWAPGHDLDAHRVPAEALTRWLVRAASTLGGIQGATLDEAGEVLVHGDFWLGCVVVIGDRISGIIDWTDAHRGDPRTDLRSLVAVLAERPDIALGQRRQILRVVQQAHDQAGGPAAARAGLDDLLAR